MTASVRDLMTESPRSIESGSDVWTDRDAFRFVTIGPQQELDEALRLMARHQPRRLPVVETNGKLVGIVAHADIARNASGAQTSDLVEDISK